MQDKQFIGVDVSKAWLDVATHGQTGGQRIDNTEAAIAEWIKTLDPQRLGLVAFEPTGGYERCLQHALREAGIRFCRVHPNEFVAFRRRRAVKAKTDAMDAKLLADFAAMELASRGLAPILAGDEALRELSSRRRQLVDGLAAERCRMAMVHEAAAKRSFELLIGAFETALAEIENALQQHLEANAQAAEMAGLMRSVKGVGPVASQTLLAELPELGTLSGKQIAALVGLAPQQRESGKQRGRAATGHGRPGVRRVLFNAARIGIRYNPVLREFYERLVHQNGRPGKVAMLATMRKLLVILNAIVKEKQPWKYA